MGLLRLELEGAKGWDRKQNVQDVAKVVQEEPRASVSLAPSRLLRPEKAPDQRPLVPSKSLGLSTMIRKE